ncbi:MAG: hypothetical protein HYZ22_17150 [Chloroflexi bacterium]|nr:hypothetical protein [Chloroflexota bacterium]
MNQNFIYTIQKLGTTNNAIANFKMQACKIVSMAEAKYLLDELKLRIEISLDTRSKDELPYYYLLAAHCYIFFEKRKEAEKYSAMAIDNFRICGMSWNEAMGHWFLGLIYRLEGRGYLYITELNKALEIVTPIMAEYQIRGNYAAAMNSEEIVNVIQEQRSYAAKMGTGPLHMPAEKKEENTTVKNSGYLILPWLLKYDSVRAGPNGIAWVHPPNKNGTVVHVMEIDGISCQLIPIRFSSIMEDHQITLINGISYGWTRVSGQSMNASTPVPIEDGDYVLFSMQFENDKDAIVIASRQIANGDYAHMVKKYVAKDRTLVSETIDNSEDYSPMHLDEGYQILGAVIALAKPIT